MYQKGVASTKMQVINRVPNKSVKIDFCMEKQINQQITLQIEIIPIPYGKISIH